MFDNCRSLNLENCIDVTDTGIQWLCRGTEYPEMRKESPRLCKTLQRLSILYTSVTQRGIQIALTHLLSLIVLPNYFTIEALVELAQRAIDSKRPGYYNDRFCTSVLYTPRYNLFRSDRLRLALSLCHSVTRVGIHVIKGLKDSDLLCFQECINLQGLKMLKCLPFFPNETEITFDGGVAPLLEAFGKSLETLSLEYFDSAPISTIAEFCPNLTWLHINNVTGSLDNERDLGCIKEKVPMFKDLKFLFCHDDIQPDILLLLLSSPSLQHISISDCDTLSDEVLQKAAINYYGFQNLQKLQLSHCNSVSGRGIEALLVDSNPIEIISFFGCKNLGSANNCKWSKLIVKNNWNLKCFVY